MCSMNELELDMITDHTTDEKVHLEEEPQEPEVIEIKSCCRCGDILGQDEEQFDSDSCVHCVCVRCRFRDGLQCLLCGLASSKATSKSAELIPNKVKDVFYSKLTMFMPRKKFNKDHIVDVECEGDGSVQKQMCTVCQRVFKKTNAPYHYACATGDKPFSCPECRQKFVKKSHMEAHLNSHYGIKPFKCSKVKCKASFYQKDKLIRHMKTHDKNVKHTCLVCDKKYASQAIMNLHIEKVHTTAVKSFQCDLCPRSYKYKRSLRIHRLKHLAIREYMCEVCGKKYTLFSQLKHHKRSHVVYHRRPHKCSCGRRFMTRRDRARHELIHTTSRSDFECSLCNTTFGRKDNLERHMKNFHAEDPPVLSKAKLTAMVAPFVKTPQSNSSISDCKSNQPQTSTKLKETTKKSSVQNKNFNKICKTKDSKKTKKRKKKSDKDTLETSGSQTEHLISTKALEETPILNNTPPVSVIVSPKPSENQNRPSVIKSMPKLLPYRILPPDKRFLKITEHLTNNKTISNVMPPSDLNTKSNVNTFNSPSLTDVNTFNTPSVSDVNTLNMPSVTDANTFSIPSVIEINQNNCSLLSMQPNSSSLMDNSRRKTPCGGKPATSQTPRRRISTDDALNRCFRIIRHTNRVQVEPVAVQNIPQRSINTLEEDLQTMISRPNKITASSNKRLSSAKSMEQIEYNKMQRPVRDLDRYTSDIVPNSVIDYSTVIGSQVPVSNVVGGPSLPTSFSLPENASELNQEDNFNNSYVPLAESCYSTYTPYFDNDCFRDSYYEASAEQLLPNDLDIGFQYINEQLSCAEMNFTSDSRVVRYVSQETRVVKESFR